jgi:hypothetical protein
MPSSCNGSTGVFPLGDPMGADDSGNPRERTEVVMTVLSREVEDDRGRELRDWLTLRDWMLLCLGLEAGEGRVGLIETQQSGQSNGKAFLTDRRLICTHLTTEGLYLPYHVRGLDSVNRVVTLPAERTMLLLASPQHLDLIIRVHAPRVMFEQFTKLVRATVAWASRQRDGT